MRFGESTDMDQRSRLEFKVCGLSLADSPAVAWRVVKVMLGKPFMALCRSAIPTQQCNKQLRKTTQNRGVSFPPPASAAKAYVVLSAVLLFLLGRIAVLRSTVKPRLHDTTCCQTGCQTDLTTGCIVYTNIQPIVKPVWQPVVSCQLGFTDPVAWSVCRSVCHDREPCKNHWTDRDAVCGVDSDGSHSSMF